MVTALAAAVRGAGALTWPQARQVLREADPLFAGLDPVT
jgi:hypothetical protein